jgi:hypothetical protein
MAKAEKVVKVVLRTPSDVRFSNGLSKLPIPRDRTNGANESRLIALERVGTNALEDWPVVDWTVVDWPVSWRSSPEARFRNVNPTLVSSLGMTTGAVLSTLLRELVQPR